MVTDAQTDSAGSSVQPSRRNSATQLAFAGPSASTISGSGTSGPSTARSPTQELQGPASVPADHVKIQARMKRFLGRSDYRKTSCGVLYFENIVGNGNPAANEDTVHIFWIALSETRMEIGSHRKGTPYTFTIGQHAVYRGDSYP